MAHPALHAWSAERPLRLVEPAVTRDDPDPQAVACYGLLLRQDAASLAGERAGLWLRFVDGRPVGALTIQFLAWCSETVAPTGTTTLLLVWDNASWHTSGAVRRWLGEHNRRVHREGGVRIIPCFLPTKSPWLNPIESQWVHGKRRITEPARLLSAREVEERVCQALHCPLVAHLTIPQEVT